MKSAKKGVYTPPSFFHLLFSIGMEVDFPFNEALYGATFSQYSLFMSRTIQIRLL